MLFKPLHYTLVQKYHKNLVMGETGYSIKCRTHEELCRIKPGRFCIEE